MCSGTLSCKEDKEPATKIPEPATQNCCTRQIRFIKLVPHSEVI